MTFKFYENGWIPAIKGIFFLIFGLFAFIKGSTFETASIFYDVMIFLIAILYLAIGFLTKGIKKKEWIIFVGFIHLGFAIWLTLNWGGESLHLLWIISLWIIFSALTDLVEAILMFVDKNVLGTLFLINMLVTFVFAYFTILLQENYTVDALRQFGLVAILTGLITESSGFILSKTRFLSE